MTNKTNPKAAVTNKIVPTVVSKDGDKGGRDDSQEGQDDDDEQIEQTSRCDDNFVPTVVNNDGASSSVLAGMTLTSSVLFLIENAYTWNFSSDSCSDPFG